MARSVPAPSTRAVRPPGRGAAPQEEAERRTAGDQGTSVAAVQGLVMRGDEDKDHEDHDDDNEESQSAEGSSSSSGEPSEDEKQLKPPARSKGATKMKPDEDPDKRKEGTADDIPIP